VDKHLKELQELREECKKLRQAVEASGPVCNCKGPKGLKRLGYKYKLEWDCPKHGREILW
jgi:hypothetical protein